MNNSPIDRFAQTVENYIKYRPSYPLEIIDLLIKSCGLTKNSIIADIGSGTGLLTQLFLRHGNVVYGVEPSQAMRHAAQDFLKDESNFLCIEGSAESTHLKNASVDIITVGTAFHWFDVEEAKKEFKRILKKKGWVVLIWNVRDIENSLLQKEYEQLLLAYAMDYKDSQINKFDSTVMSLFFAPNPMYQAVFKNVQKFNWEGLKGRLLSTSYSLRPGDLHYEDMITELQAIYARYQKSGQVNFDYQTKVYFGQPQL